MFSRDNLARLWPGLSGPEFEIDPDWGVLEEANGVAYNPDPLAFDRNRNADGSAAADISQADL